MPIDSRSRPIGVTVLSLIAFAVSPVFLVLLGLFLHHIFVESIPPSFSDDTGAFLWLSFWLPIASACFLTLSWISFKAGLDLWRLKNRGRKLAYISMILFFLLGIVYLLIRENLVDRARSRHLHSQRIFFRISASSLNPAKI